MGTPGNIKTENMGRNYDGTRFFFYNNDVIKYKLAVKNLANSSKTRRISVLRAYINITGKAYQKQTYFYLQGSTEERPEIVEVPTQFISSLSLMMDFLEPSDDCNCGLLNHSVTVLR